MTSQLSDAVRRTLSTDIDIRAPTTLVRNACMSMGTKSAPPLAICCLYVCLRYGHTLEIRLRCPRGRERFFHSGINQKMNAERDEAIFFFEIGGHLGKRRRATKSQPPNDLFDLLNSHRWDSGKYCIAMHGWYYRWTTHAWVLTGKYRYSTG